MSVTPLPLSRVGNKFRVCRRIGSGAFGEIFEGRQIQTGEPVAIKLEPLTSRTQQLLFESRLYRILNTGGGALGIPGVRWYGEEGAFTVLVMDLLGRSLEELFTACGRRFSLKTVLMLADQMISRLEFLHQHGFVHRDMKPDNFLEGLGRRQHIFYLIDYGLAKRFLDVDTGMHVEYSEGKRLTGTARYSSVNTHLGMEQTRRDDMEALGYIWMYFLRGSLPWQGITARTKAEKFRLVSERKMTTTVEDLCEGVPPEFAVYLNYCKSLSFADRPHYAYMKKIFRDLFQSQGFEHDFVYDWTVPVQ